TLNDMFKNLSNHLEDRPLNSEDK
ncbi:MerR family transcriptional regulator, partial [Streptococcus mutans]|nr:MerR family transcriptional regulator [Streptococcus mutans]